MKNRLEKKLQDSILQQIAEGKTLVNDEVLELINIFEEKQKEQEKILSQNSKMASMGEMIDFVAHQWKQPLNSFSMMSELLKQDYRDGIVTQYYIDELTATVDTQLEHLLSTLKEFRTFLKPGDNKEHSFLLQDTLESVEVLMKDELIINNIIIKYDIEDELSIYADENEFKHIFLNLLANTIDVFNERKKLLSRHISIRAYSKDSLRYIEFEDNAGGIPDGIIEQVFEPHFTTKEAQGGTGIGLYMSSKIIQKYNGTIEVSNSQIGALFTMILK